MNKQWLHDVVDHPPPLHHPPPSAIHDRSGPQIAPAVAEEPFKEPWVQQVEGAHTAIVHEVEEVFAHKPQDSSLPVPPLHHVERDKIHDASAPHIDPNLHLKKV